MHRPNLISFSMLSFALALTSLPSCVVSPGIAPTLPSGTVDSFGVALNEERAEAGHGPLVLNSALQAAASAHATDMVVRGYFAHETPEGRSPRDRMRAKGYRDCVSAENIAEGYRTAPEVLGEWMASPGHRRNNLNPRVNEYGLARVDDTWVLKLGRRC